MERLLCTRCGDSIHPDTAANNNGLCVPCVRGNQLTIEQRKQNSQRIEDARQAWLNSPSYRYWSTLIHRVYDPNDGFDRLPQADQLYFLINVLRGEIANGGIEQFFTNTSGGRYEATLDALLLLKLLSVKKILQEAKQLLFDDQSVPTSQSERCQKIATATDDESDLLEVNEALDALDRRIRAHNSEVDAALDELVVREKLY